MFLQPKIHLGFGSRKHHGYKIIRNMQPLQKTTRILFKLRFKEQFFIIKKYEKKTWNGINNKFLTMKITKQFTT